MGWGFAIGCTSGSCRGNRIWSFRAREKIIIVNGCFWHRHTCGACRLPAARRAYWVRKIDRNAARDRRTRRALTRLGWRVLVVWECQTKPRRQPRLAAKLAAFLNAFAA